MLTYEDVFLKLILFFCFRVVCKCKLCGTEKQALSDWVKHTGSKFKNWRTSVRVKDSMLPLEQWVCINDLFFVLFILHISSPMSILTCLDRFLLWEWCAAFWLDTRLLSAWVKTPSNDYKVWISQSSLAKFSTHCFFSILVTHSTIFKYHVVYTKDLLRTLEKCKLPVSKITVEIESWYRCLAYNMNLIPLYSLSWWLLL